MKRGKLVSVQDAVCVIRDGDTVAFGGFVGIGFAEAIAIEIERRFLDSGHPCNLTLIYAAGMGDGKERGLSHLAHKGLLKRVIGGHWGLCPRLQELSNHNQVEAYNLPQGVISHMYRDIAADKPRTITRVGLGTFVDPQNGGGKLNSCTTEDLVERISFDGQDYLAYKTQSIDVAILRGTTSDLDGNITMEREALTLEILPIGMAARNSGGFVIVQVERIADRGSLNAREVKLPSIFVDCVVKAEAHYHPQTFAEAYNPAYSSEIKVPLASIEPLPLTERKVICRRAAFELLLNSVVNLGIGVPEGVARVAAEEGILDYLTLTAEPGVIGGIPAGGLSFGAATNVEAVIDMPYQFDFYDGGGLDIAVLGLAQADRVGNLNVSKFGPKLAGAGGFINISQNAKKVVFAGTFTASGLDVAIEGEKLSIVNEGRIRKFVDAVDHVTFSGEVSVRQKQTVFYITERCVFKLTNGGLELIEIAPGIDIEKHILAQMEFRPLIPTDPAFMDERIFRSTPMDLLESLLSIPLEDRFMYQAKECQLFINFEGLAIRSAGDIDKIRGHVDRICGPLGHRVRTIVNYDNFFITPELLDAYTLMVKQVTDRYYSEVMRYTTSAFMRMKLGESLQKRGVAPHIFETKQEAQKALLKTSL